MLVSLICAVSRNGIIGRGNQLPWKLPNDLKRFKALTMGHPIIMVRKTFESIGKPLPGRDNVVVSRQPGYRAEGCHVVASLEEALKVCRAAGEAFVIGGASLYEEALPAAHRIYLTEVHQDIAGDVRMPLMDHAVWGEISRENHPADDTHPYAYSFVTLEKR